MSNSTPFLSLNLKRLRKKARLNQAELAEAAGLATRSYQDIEYGHSHPRSDNLTALAKALGVPVAELFIDPTQPSKAKLVSEMTQDELKKTITAGPSDLTEELKFLKSQYDKILDQLVNTKADLELEKKTSQQLRSRLSVELEAKETAQPRQLKPEGITHFPGYQEGLDKMRAKLQEKLKANPGPDEIDDVINEVFPELIELTHKKEDVG